MKNIFIWILSLLSFSNIKAQFSTADNNITGIDKFTLGDLVSKFAADIKPLRTSLSSDSKSYQYLNAMDDSIKVGNVYFNIVMLDFDKSDRLVGIYINKFFRTIDFLEQSRKEYKSSIDYVSNILNKEGAEKEYYPNIHKGYEWETVNTKIKVDLQETRDRSSTTVGFALTLKK